MSREPDISDDVLGAPFTSETIDLGRDDEGPVVATLVRRVSEDESRRAVLYLHGFSDYFFHVELAQWWADRGYDFYALDLRKYGRSLRAHQTPAWTTDLHVYFEDLDAACQRITERDGHDEVVVVAHSTGGLTAPLWLHHRRPTGVVGLVLNSPWFDLQGAAWRRSLPGRVALDVMGARQPLKQLVSTVESFYGRSLHRDRDGEWDYDERWKPDQGMAVHYGWLRAVRRGHAELHRGLDVPCPSLVLSSGGTVWPKAMGEDVHTHDIVLDVRQIRRWASSLGRHVTSVAIDGARHDVFLSRQEPREAAYREVDTWLSAHVERR
jgi:alpha-beta hydrolase superfamily lysophospholipase